MKLWASASTIGLSMAYFAAACSSTPPDDNVCTTCGGPGGSGGASAGTTMSTAGTSAGTPASMGGTPGGGGVPATAGSAGTPTGGGSMGGAGAGTGGGGAGGGGGGKVACPANVQGHCSEATYPPYPGYTLQLVEDFPEAIDLDKDPIWTWSDGSPADGQTGFRKEQITFSNGHMILTAEAPPGCAAKTTNAGCIPARPSFGEALSPNKQAQVGAMGVWSGELRTKYNNYRYGHYEVKYSAPIANPGQENTDNMSGDFLSTMFIFRTPKNVKWNEIDIELEPNHHDKVAGNMVNATGATGYPGGNALPFVADAPAGYNISQEHVYAFDWTPTKVDWFLDGKLIHTTMGSAADPIPSLSAKIMMNLWVFSGNAFGEGVNNKFPFHATYDYFRFYKLDSETMYPCATPPACLAADDKTVSAQNNPNEVNYGM